MYKRQLLHIIHLKVQLRVGVHLLQEVQLKHITLVNQLLQSIQLLGQQHIVHPQHLILVKIRQLHTQLIQQLSTQPLGIRQEIQLKVETLQQRMILQQRGKLVP